MHARSCARCKGRSLSLSSARHACHLSCIEPSAFITHQRAGDDARAARAGIDPRARRAQEAVRRWQSAHIKSGRDERGRREGDEREVDGKEIERG